MFNSDMLDNILNGMLNSSCFTWNRFDIFGDLYFFKSLWKYFRNNTILESKLKEMVCIFKLNL